MSGRFKQPIQLGEGPPMIVYCKDCGKKVTASVRSDQTRKKALKSGAVGFLHTVDRDHWIELRLPADVTERDRILDAVFPTHS